MGRESPMKVAVAKLLKAQNYQFDKSNALHFHLYRRVPYHVNLRSLECDNYQDDGAPHR